MQSTFKIKIIKVKSIQTITIKKIKINDSCIIIALPR
jgi:hypothetical protein